MGNSFYQQSNSGNALRGLFGAAPSAAKKPAAGPKPVGAWDASPQERENLISTSRVKTATPYTGSQARRYSSVASAYNSGGTNSGEQSLNAWARAAQLQQQSAANQSLGDLSKAYQTKAQQVRASDVYNQRADQVRRFGLSEGQRADRRAQDVNLEQQRLNNANAVSVARQNAQTNLLNSALSLVAGGGIMNSLATIGQLRAVAPQGVGGLGMPMANVFGPGWGSRSGVGPVGSSLLGR